MPPKSKPTKPPADLQSLITLTKTSQNLLTHFQSSLTASSLSARTSTPSSPTPTTPTPNPPETIKATTTLLRSHTTTLSLLLLTPPLTPSAVMQKIGDVSTGALTVMVAAATSTPSTGQADELGQTMRAELRAQVRRLLGTWGDILALVLRFAERREQAGTAKKDEGPTESEKQDVLAATGVVWEACDALLKVCQDGVVGLVVKKAEEWRGVLVDAVEELKEWGEDVDDEDGDENQEEEEDVDEFGDEDDMFGAANKLGKGDKELKALLDKSVKRLKMVGMLYQALIKRRLKTFPRQPPSAIENTNGESTTVAQAPIERLDKVLILLKTMTETVDELASAFYDLDEDEAKQTLDKCCGEAKSAIGFAKQSWTGQDDEFTAWSTKWVDMLEAS